ncbi:MAG: PQQ-dependent sugar dehydrogenase [Verrucomicrobia bacterium]|nr:PQQ-dependent sugar dehydrogenase [Verrucomicrobiota bacterium]
MFPSFQKVKRFGATAFVSTLMIPSTWAQPEPSGPPPEAKNWRTVLVAQGIRHPWGLTWLPDGRALVTAKHGTLHVLEGDRFVSVPMVDLPEVFSRGQGALMDIALHPQFEQNQRIYMTLSTGSEKENRTILVRGVFDGRRVSKFETLFRAEPTKDSDQHFGSRLVWLPDGTLLMSIGDGGNPPQRIGNMLAREQAQNLGSHLGSVLRLTEDGKPAPNNPFLNRQGAQPEIWSYGHRNIQGMTRDPKSGRVWANEHGPRGGDELNLIERGRNYGWPLHTYGRDYRTGKVIGKEDVENIVYPKVAWVPAHPPSGLAFYTGDRYPNWRGSLFSGGLASKDIRRIALDENGNVVGQERLTVDRRIRDVRQGPDGFLYVITDEENGRLLRIETK